jgi:hypothetical protein
MHFGLHFGLLKRHDRAARSCGQIVSAKAGGDDEIEAGMPAMRQPGIQGFTESAGQELWRRRK